MKRALIFASCFFALSVFSQNSFAGTITAGDIDYAAGRNGYDDSTNMDHYVFNGNGSFNNGITNNNGSIQWSFTPPSGVGTYINASLFLSTFDVDQSDFLRVYYSVNEGTHTYLGNVTELSSNNSYIFTDFENDVNNLVDLSTSPLWTTTTINLSGILSILNTTSLSNITFYIENLDGSDNWGAVLDYAQLNYDAVPEPATMLLFGTGVIGLLAGRVSRRNRPRA